ncbi:MAG TPA: VWA domain-containing protein [Acidobacteriaceae bacterium]
MPGASPVSNAPAEQEVQNTPGMTTFRTNTNLVSLFFTAYGKNNQPVTNLKKQDCTLFEDRVAQTTKSFEQMVDLPLTLGILLDTSGSQEKVLPLEQQTGSAFLKRIMKPKDEAFLISFDVNVDLLADYTNNVAELERAMNKAQINVGGGFGNGGIPGLGQGPVSIQKPRGTLLYDAVYLAAHDKMHQEAGRKVLILLTDGEDMGSQETMNSTLEAAQKSNVLIYVILLADRAGYAQAGQMYGGDSAMHKLTEETGGRVIDVGTNGKKLEAAFQQIEDELRTQYLASYTPLDPAQDGSFRLINIKCTGAQKIQTRKGYYASAGGSSE